MKKHKKLVLYALFVFNVIVLVILILQTTINNIIIKNYDNYKYSTTLGKLLYVFNIRDKYIAYYNNGNLYYQTGKYQKALDNYNKALSYNIKERSKICKVRINQSMAMVAVINTNQDRENIKNELIKAKENLYINKCTSSSSISVGKQIGDECEEKIQELIDNLDNASGSSQDYSEVESSIKEEQKQASASRNDELEKYESVGSSDYAGKKW